MKIDLVDFQTVVNRILNHIIETRKITELSIDKNFYWNVPENLAYDMNAEVECDVGSLEDDWEFVSCLLSSDEVPLAFQLTEVAPLVRCIGEELGRLLASEGG